MTNAIFGGDYLRCGLLSVVVPVDFNVTGLLAVRMILCWLLLLGPVV